MLTNAGIGLHISLKLMTIDKMFFSLQLNFFVYILSI